MTRKLASKMKFAVVDTLHYGNHGMYDDGKIMSALDAMNFEWIEAQKFWGSLGLDTYNIDFKPNDKIAVIELRDISQLALLAEKADDKIYIDYDKHVIIPTWHEPED